MILWAKRVGSSGAIVTSLSGPMPKRAVGEQELPPMPSDDAIDRWHASCDRRSGADAVISRALVRINCEQHLGTHRLPLAVLLNTACRVLAATAHQDRAMLAELNPMLTPEMLDRAAERASVYGSKAGW